MHSVTDLRTTIIPKSDQLNADQLLAGPMTITVTKVDVTSSEDQPVVVHYDGENGRPYKPCKTMRKLLIYAWGEDGTQWAGRSATLYCDTSVRFGGMDVGGIRISHLSHIEKDMRVSLTSTRGKKAEHFVRLLRDQAEKKAPTKTLAQIQADIAACETLEGLEAIRPFIRELERDDKAVALQAAKERAEAIRSAAEPVAEPEQNGGDLV